MGDVDAGNVKAKASIEYDGSGLKQMKEDLASLSDVIGSGLEQGTKSAGDALSGLDEKAAKSAESAKSFTSAISELPKITENSASTISEMTSALSEHQSAVEETGAAYESLQKPVSDTVSLFSDIAPQIQAVSEHTQSLQGQMSVASDSFVQASQSMSQAAPTFREAFNIPTDAVLQFDESGRLIGDSVKYFENASTGAQSFGKSFQGASSGVQAFNSQVGDLNTTVAQASKAINEFGGVGEGMYGPLPKMAEPIGIGEAFGNAGKGLLGALDAVAMPLMAIQMIGMAVQATGQAIYDSAVIVEGKAAHSYGSFTGTVDTLGHSIQNLGGQFSESFGQSIKPTLDVLNYQFADQGGVAGFVGESVGGALGILFNLGQIASGINPMGGIAGLESMFGLTSVEGPAPFSVNPMQGQIDQLNQAANNPQLLAAQASYQSASSKAMQRQEAWDVSHYAGTTGPDDPMNEILQAQVVRANGGTYGTVPQDPNLAWLNDLGNPSGGGGADFGTVHSLPGGNSSSFQGTPGGGVAYFKGSDTETTSAFADIGQAYANIVAPKVLNDQQMKDMQGFFGGIGNGISGFFGNAFAGIDKLFSGFNNNLLDTEPLSLSGCFPAGTQVLMSDGTEKPIEDIQVDDIVFAHDGEHVVPTPVLALIRPPKKPVYRLVFSDGNTLTLTDSHPLATPLQGWKSISPEATKQENPDLQVTPLQVGDSVHTIDGACTLISIAPLQGKVQVYNITVGEPHTFYAGGVLVHNKTTSAAIGQQAAEQIGDIQLPHMDLSGMSAQLAGNFSSIELPHMDMSGISGSLAGAFSGISMPPIPAIGSEISGALGGMFSGITMPAVPDIGGEISGALGGMFGGITMPAIPDVGGEISGALSGMFGGISMPAPPDVGSMLSGALSGVFGGVEVPSPPDVGSMINGAMSGMFGGIQIPAPPNLGAMISSSMSGMFSGISLPSVPFFAEGVSNFGGGAAMVGEAGPEVVGYNGRYSLFDKGASLVNLPSGSSVYPMKELAGGSVAQFANGTGGGSFSPFAMGGGSRDIVVNVTHLITLDGYVLAQQTIPHIASMADVASGNRSY